MRKYLIFLYIILFSFNSPGLIAQNPIHNYLDSLIKADSIKNSGNPIVRKLPALASKDTPKIERKEKEYSYWNELIEFYANEKIRPWFTFFKKAPPRKNRIYFSWPFRTDKSIGYIAEYRPTFERDITGWLSVYFGPSLYGRKMQGSYRGDYITGGSYPKIAMFGLVAPYYIDGWGQNYGVKMYWRVHGEFNQRLGLNLAYQQRHIRIYGTRAIGEVKGLEKITYVYQSYFISTMDKTVKDGRLRILLQYDFDFEQDYWYNVFTINFYGGVGVPLWGHFDDKIRKISGDRKYEWNSGNTNNVIMMRNYDLYLGFSLGFFFGDFWKTNKNKK